MSEMRSIRQTSMAGFHIRYLARLLLLPTVLVALFGQQASAGATAQPERPPNILLIVADDLGYSDLGVFGSEIRTPHIDALARSGMIFTQFHTSPYCAPSRAMLLSGNNNHVAGIAHQGLTHLAGHSVPGYENHLSDRVMPFTKVLQNHGYRTYVAGKWHLGRSDKQEPGAAGFDRSWVLLQGAATYFDDLGYTEGGSLYRADGALVSYPKGRYATELYTEKLIEFIEQGLEDERPFFAFASYTAPHWPLQLPESYLNRYAGRYAEGYDELRRQRFDSLQASGIISEQRELPAPAAGSVPWTDLDTVQRKVESRKMELYASLVENLDFHIGRLLAFLDDKGVLDNTVVLFLSDNGAEGEDYFGDAAEGSYLKRHFSGDYDQMGSPNSFVFLGHHWAAAATAPYRGLKGSTYQGGILAPLIITGPGVNARGTISHEYLTIMDLAPTVLDIAAATLPDVREDEFPMLGVSIHDFLTGRSDGIHDDTYVTVLSHGGKTLLRQGDWKLVEPQGPFQESDLQLYNLAEDPFETVDLKNRYPDQFSRLLDTWREKRRELGIILPQDL